MEFTLNLGVVSVKGQWNPNESERHAAWEMYVELVTRISVAELRSGEGLLREALSSLYTIFATTRSIMKAYGPEVAQPKGNEEWSFGLLAVKILNDVLRPLLATWHPLLLDHEESRRPDVSALEHERQWSEYENLRNNLNAVRLVLIEYADVLGRVADVDSLIFDRTEEPGG